MPTLDYSSNFLFYDPLAGELQFYRGDYNSPGVIYLLQTLGWRSSWKQIVLGNFDGSGRSFLFYDGAGTGEFYGVTGGGVDGDPPHLQLLRAYTGWQSNGKPWTHIITGKFSDLDQNYTELLFYDSAGTGKFFTTSGQADLELLRTYSGWQSNGEPWTHIIPVWIPGIEGGGRALLFYDSAGTGKFFTTSGQADLTLVRAYTGWQSNGKPWTHIISIPYGLLFYDSAGTGKIYRLKEHGEMSLVREYTGWQSNGKPWKQIIPFQGSAPSPGGRRIVFGLLFYDGAGIGKFFEVTPQGDLISLNEYSDWRASWSKIIAFV